MASKSESNTQAATWLEPQQVNELRNVCYNEEFATYLQQRNEAIVALLYDAGLRVTELVDIDVDHLRFEDGELHLPPEVQKDYRPEDSPSTVTIDLADDTVRLLNGYLNHRWKDTDALFPSRKAERMSPQGVRHMLKKVARVADVQPQRKDGSRGNPDSVTPQVFRHSLARAMLRDSKNSLVDVQCRLRHQSLHTTERLYNHFQE